MLLFKQKSRRLASALILNIKFISSYYSYNIFSQQAYLEFHVRFHQIFGSEQSLFDARI